MEKLTPPPVSCVPNGRGEPALTPERTEIAEISSCKLRSAFVVSVAIGFDWIRAELLLRNAAVSVAACSRLPDVPQVRLHETRNREVHQAAIRRTSFPLVRDRCR